MTRDGENTPTSDRGGRLAMLVVVLVIAGNLLGQALSQMMLGGEGGAHEK